MKQLWFVLAISKELGSVAWQCIFCMYSSSDARPSLLPHRWFQNVVTITFPDIVNTIYSSQAHQDIWQKYRVTVVLEGLSFVQGRHHQSQQLTHLACRDPGHDFFQSTEGGLICCIAKDLQNLILMVQMAYSRAQKYSLRLPPLTWHPMQSWKQARVGFTCLQLEVFGFLWGRILITEQGNSLHLHCVWQ